MKKWLSGAAALVIAGGILAGCSDSAEKAGGDSGKKDGMETKFATIATGGASGPYNIIATSLAEMYSKEYGVNSKTQTTGASVENINLMKQEKVEMAFVMSDVLSEAVNGEGNFDSKVDNVQQIASLYPNFVQVVTSEKSGINTFEDLKGKRIAVGAQNSGVEVNARNLLNGHGISYDDIKVDYLGYAEAADALKAGKLDAAFLTSGIPNASLMELGQGFDLKIVPIEKEKIEKIAKDQPYFTSQVIPANTYGNKEDVPTAAIMNALVVRSDLSENDVYLLTKTFFENLDGLENAHQAAKDISIEKAEEGLIAPLHPGAKKYYEEQK
ncbi:C4-dicarboxylate ABC transporter substrate-binding protein [Fictibacillus phosphorivorans]|uniref:C4-dicarboxylate ABC transporter substrate-binding protein n=2 Tax=Fictibacillus phosphorivorans TaxID=1221500 RepID=A0A163Q0G2_9BACL|nr:C4-dicarboxylate ABC transporter substrate-binding protein [Fictibacillus phosphorivorans]